MIDSPGAITSFSRRRLAWRILVPVVAFLFVGVVISMYGSSPASEESLSFSKSPTLPSSSSEATFDGTDTVVHDSNGPISEPIHEDASVLPELDPMHEDPSLLPALDPLPKDYSDLFFGTKNLFYGSVVAAYADLGPWKAELPAQIVAGEEFSMRFTCSNPDPKICATYYIVLF